MKITFLVHGSQGDVLPCIVFGKALKKAGHTVSVVATTEFKEIIEEHTLTYSSLNLEIKELYNERVGDSIDKDKKGRGAFSEKNKMEIEKVFGDSLRNAYQACQGSDFLLLSGVSLFYGMNVAEKLNIPYMFFYVYPMRRTATNPAFLFPRLKIGGWYNLLTYWIEDNVFWLLAGKTVNKWRIANDLPPLKGKEIFNINHIAPTPTIYCFSQHVFPKPHDYGDNVLIPGYFFLDEEKTWKPSSELLHFLESGPPPVYIGFGSVSELVGLGKYDHYYTIVMEAIKQTGQRYIVGIGNSAKKVELPDNIFITDHIPHSWIFPRMKAVVHHGGAGTTAEGLRAGIPSVILPIMGDQPFWGEQVFRINAGPKPVQFKKLNVAGLVNAINEAVNNQGIAESAKRIGEKIRNEDGVTSAVQFINKYLKVL